GDHHQRTCFGSAWAASRRHPGGNGQQAPPQRPRARPPRHLLPRAARGDGAQGAEGQVQEQRPRLRLVDAEPGDVPRGLLRGLPDRPGERHPLLPDLPALRAARLEPVLGHPRRRHRLDRGQRLAREQGVLPPGDPAAGSRGRQPRPLLPAGDRARPRHDRVPLRRRAPLPLAGGPRPPRAAGAHGGGRHLPRLRQRVRPRHPAPARARPAGVVLDDADRVPLRPGRRQPGQPGPLGHGGAREPDDLHRPRVPAGVLRDPVPPGRQGGRRDPPRREPAVVPPQPGGRGCHQPRAPGPGRAPVRPARGQLRRGAL
ncbi:MAG: O-antigen export system permease protein RfbD, partial [uncultured Acidimicrobiales bacterium]